MAMILFTKENAELIIKSLKTQTRRYWKTKRMSPGKVYYCQTSLKPNTRFARIRCLNIWEWDGKTISEKDAIAEGFSSSDAFLEKYNNLNQHKLEATDRTHYAIEFELLESYKDGVATIHYTQEYYIDKERGLLMLGRNNM